VNGDQVSDGQEIDVWAIYVRVNDVQENGGFQEIFVWVIDVGGMKTYGNVATANGKGIAVWCLITAQEVKAF